ncbi:hypothetical protein ONE63_003905 [Megalurothrips usitatus]|uniref:Uncharacterized protein n=1 Tax=Megalurothrips usitatus TaxID=439358 RepID=A0AAV7XAH1_9NEOP|nr:hypothetical protein ONE63_003905 [Megalurothrips usitatus]
MTLPVSSYEELLARVRGLTRETAQLQRALALDDNGARDHNHNGPVLEVTAATAAATRSPPPARRTYRNSEAADRISDASDRWSPAPATDTVSRPFKKKNFT